jgi:hypothetical protein
MRLIEVVGLDHEVVNDLAAFETGRHDTQAQLHLVITANFPLDLDGSIGNGERKVPNRNSA